MKHGKNEDYDCETCSYRDKESNFCGCCIRRIVDQLKSTNKTKKHESNGGNGEERSSIHKLQ